MRALVEKTWDALPDKTVGSAGRTALDIDPKKMEACRDR